MYQVVQSWREEIRKEEEEGRDGDIRYDYVKRMIGENRGEGK